MGMDIYGKHPKSEIGKYYRGDIYGWNNLAKHIVQTCPKEITGKVPNWFTNDGYGLDEADSTALAQILEEQVKTGLEFIPELYPVASHLDDLFVRLPDFINAATTAGSGEEVNPEEALEIRFEFMEECKPIEDLPVGVPESAVTEFAAFLRECGGFEIW
jgi:hypothetical protein